MSALRELHRSDVDRPRRQLWAVSDGGGNAYSQADVLRSRIARFGCKIRSANHFLRFPTKLLYDRGSFKKESIRTAAFRVGFCIRC
jgi:hypothetical protein